MKGRSNILASLFLEFLRRMIYNKRVGKILALGYLARMQSGTIVCLLSDG